MRKIKDYEIVDHGLDYPDYFQGCGVAFTSFEAVATGCGMNPAEAFQDALEQIAMSEIGEVDLDEFEQRILVDENLKEFPTEPEADSSEDSDEQYYLSIRYNL